MTATARDQTTECSGEGRALDAFGAAPEKLRHERLVIVHRAERLNVGAARYVDPAVERRCSGSMTRRAHRRERAPYVVRGIVRFDLIEDACHRIGGVAFPPKT